MKVEHKIIAAFSIALLAVFLVGMATYLNARNLLQRNNLVIHTYTVLSHIDNVLNSAAEIQTGARGYLLTGENAYLQPYQAGIDAVGGEIAALRGLIQDNPVQQRNVELLESDVNRAIANVHQELAAKQAAPDQPVANTGTADKENMDQVRFITTKMKAEENRLLAVRSEQSQVSAQRTIINFGLLLVLAVVLLVAFQFFIRHDLAERRRIDEVVRASDKKFRAVMDGAPDAMFITDQQGHVQMANSQAEVLFGYTRNEFEGRQLDSLLVGRELVPHATENDGGDTPEAQPEDSALRILDSVAVQFDGVRKDGTIFPLELSRSPLDVGGEALSITSVRDRTEYERAEESLRKFSLDLARSNAELERFAYVASHDLQEPLRMVSSYTQLLAKRYKGKLDSNADEFIAYAVDGASRMQKLINDLLALSRVGTQAKPSEPIDTGTVVARVLNDMKPTIEAAEAAISLPETMPTVLADGGQIGQLFQNLIGNAIKFRGEAPAKIDITVESIGEGECWQFTVKDNGIGIEPQYFDRIFVIFQRLHSKESYPGTGIGLAICKKIVERHGGRLWVNSAVGEGTTFFFTLPAAT